MLAKYNVSGHMAGHDHCLNHIVEGNRTAHILSGAAAQAWYAPTHKDNIKPAQLVWGMTSDNAGADQVGGFAAMQVDAAGAIVRYYDNTGALLFTAPAIHPR